MSKREDGFVNSIVGEGASFTGSIELDGLIRIDGDYLGAIKRADRVLISKTGRVKSSIKARVVVVGGALVGDVIAEERLTILSSAIVIGNIKSPKISIEEGVIFHGLCEVTTKTTEEVEGLESSFNIDWQEKSTEDKPK